MRYGRRLDKVHPENARAVGKGRERLHVAGEDAVGAALAVARIGGSRLGVPFDLRVRRGGAEVMVLVQQEHDVVLQLLRRVPAAAQHSTDARADVSDQGRPALGRHGGTQPADGLPDVGRRRALDVNSDRRLLLGATPGGRPPHYHVLEHGGRNQVQQRRHAVASLSAEREARLPPLPRDAAVGVALHPGALTVLAEVDGAVALREGHQGHLCEAGPQRAPQPLEA
mmetsp:Transcript_11130/g.35312  ORF Transcript_11130/g.35312 Transcript_11130/m.35312 type:complete len:226 (-) Transcript_11130:361-1038(-)